MSNIGLGNYSFRVKEDISNAAGDERGAELSRAELGVDIGDALWCDYVDDDVGASDDKLRSKHIRWRCT